MTLSQFIIELNGRISSAKITGFWTDIQKKGWLNTAGERVCNFKNWKDLELAQYINSEADREYYDYPSAFKPNSIYQLSVDGEQYTKTNWKEYQDYKTAESEAKIFASHDGFYFISPTITEDGQEIVVFGNRRWVALAVDADVSILPSEFDEAIIKLALAVCLQKERRYQEATVEIAEVESPANPGIPGSGGILAKISDRQEEGQKYGYIGKAQSSRWD